MASANDVGKIVQMNGGALTGKTRLQKTAYFLETLGAGFGFDFNYHHYGPFSEELSVAAEDAAALNIVNATREMTSSGVQYFVYSTRTVNRSEDADDSRRFRILQVLSKFDTISLELAATADYLRKHGYADDPWVETVARKASKASPDRITRAKQLLGEIKDLEVRT